MKMKKIKLFRVFVIAFAVAMVLGTTTTAFANPNGSETNWEGHMPQIQRGSYGSTVKGCQFFLVYNGYAHFLTPYGMDGDFGAKTADAVRAYQRLSNLVSDGIVGYNTWGRMRDQIYNYQTLTTYYTYSLTPDPKMEDFRYKRSGGSWQARISGVYYTMH